MALRFYNTLSQQLEEFSPARENTVRMYTCGPTVYDFAHIGNFRTFTFVDILRKVLRANGFALDHVMNITDVDDKIIRNAVAQHASLEDYTAVYKKAFREDCDLLRLEQPEHVVPATAHIDDMVQAIERLAASNHTYTSDGSVYFRISTFPGYGKLSHNDFSGNIAGARVDVDEYEKADARDFALWKAPKEGEPAWQTAIGPGRPGWHIECSVMAIKYLGETLDLHAGGVDLIFPHHENEIAQSESLTGKPFARFWLHCEFLMVEGQKMSKSLGNYFTLRDVVAKGYAPEAIRYLLASVPYRKQLNFTFKGLQDAATAIDRLRNFKLRLETDRFPEGADDAMAARTDAAAAAFRDSLNEDLNTAEALGAIFEYVRDANTAMDSGGFCAGNVPAALDLLRRFDSIFDVLAPTVQTNQILDSEVESLIAERAAAKKARNFARADQIREQLAEQGIILEDTKAGVRWKRK
ncbi:MAG TPA: cysteine--tRNA ligase [Bryobacteraceae bacterium]|jgi:cysteinyl-tRNA synthetase|nr:cysteine--tRNA ligase [Bryobacteraceae bacterium]